jgi:hypothetical protein
MGWLDTGLFLGFPVRIAKGAKLYPAHTTQSESIEQLSAE